MDATNLPDSPDGPDKSSRARPLVASVALLLVVALAGIWWFGIRDTTTAGAAELQGVWLTQFGEYSSFNEDGTWGVAPNPGGTPFNWGTYTFDGEVLTYYTEKPYLANTCQEGQTGIYEAGITPEGNLSLTKIEDPCRWRSTALQRELLRY